jgi:hypothetical protein
MSNFPQAYLKVQRARDHISELQLLSAPLAPELYRLSWVKGTPFPSAFHFGDPSDDSKNRQLVYEPIAPIPEIFSLMIGDAIHHLRSALDYAATQVVRVPKGDASFVTFPFHEEKKNEAAQSPGLRALKLALPKANVEHFFKNVIQCYRGGNFPLWALTKLDKIDKHNSLVPNVTTSHIHFKKLSDGMTNLRDCHIVQDVRAKFALFTALTAPKLENESEISVSISFQHGSLVGNEAVIPTLLNIGKATLEALKAFDRFVNEAEA